MKKYIILLFLFVFSFLNSSAQYKEKEYASNNGEEVKNFIAPYLKEIIQEKKINADSLVQILLGPIKYEDFIKEHDGSIGSFQYSTAGWDYFIARTPLIYQIVEIQPHLFCILYNKVSQYDFLDKNKGESTEWQVAIINDHLKIIDKKIFFTKWKYDNYSLAMWDKIYTDLKIDNRKIIALISYIHLGGGGGRMQGFEVNINYKNKIESIRVKQIVDECYDTCE